jgi:ABC-2 type transport system ATP-binding protein
VNFHVEDGEAYGLLGPNGSGKSSLIRVLSTLLTPDEGWAEIMGMRLPDQERDVRRVIGRVSVDAAYYKKLSARENLMFTARVYGLDPAVAERQSRAILEQLGFDPKRFGDPLEDMSRGMQQKIAITRALLVDPPLLLLDEPTTGLDPKSKRDVMIFIEDLRRRKNTTILLTTHDMNEAERLCERLGMLAHGKLVAEGTADELKRVAALRDGFPSISTLEDAFLALAGEKLVDSDAAPAGEVA